MSSKTTLRNRRGASASHRFRSQKARSGSWKGGAEKKQGKLIILHRPSSEPTLRLKEEEEEDSDEIMDSYSHFPSLPRFFTCTDVWSVPSSDFLSPSPSQSSEGGEGGGGSGSGGLYSEDSKVLVKVTVEGSPGPVMAILKLGLTVEETIRIVVEKYGKEGRSPPLERDASASSLQLYRSYFCLQGLNKYEKLRDIGGRSFYLRRVKTSCNSNLTESERNEIALVNINTSQGLPIQLFFGFIIGSFSKLGRRTRKLWNLLGCLPCG